MACGEEELETAGGWCCLKQYIDVSRGRAITVYNMVTNSGHLWAAGGMHFRVNTARLRACEATVAGMEGGGGTGVTQQDPHPP